MTFQYRLAGACALAVSLSVSLSACNSPAPMVTGPTSVRPAYQVANVENNGAIFRVSSAQLFEEPTTYNVGDSIKIAQKQAYEVVDQISFDGMQCRRDIGWRGLKH